MSDEKVGGLGVTPVMESELKSQVNISSLLAAS
jgi:hypothetical protein